MALFIFTGCSNKMDGFLYVYEAENEEGAWKQFEEQVVKDQCSLLRNINVAAEEEEPQMADIVVGRDGQWSYEDGQARWCWDVRCAKVTLGEDCTEAICW